MRLAILGGDGMVGRTMQCALRLAPESSRFQVVASSRKAPKPSGLFFAVPDSVDEIVTQLRKTEPCAVVVNTIAVLASDIRESDPTSVARAEHVNAWFPHALEQALPMAWPGARLLHLSTDAVFRATCGEVVENTASDAEDTYGRTKARGELSGSQSLTIRASPIGFNPEKGIGLVEFARRKWSQGEICPGFTGQRWTGCTAVQLTHFLAFLAVAENFERVRSVSPQCHFAPNPAVSKFDVLNHLAEKLRRAGSVAQVQAVSGPSLDRVLKNLPSLRPVLSDFKTDGVWDLALERMISLENQTNDAT